MYTFTFDKDLATERTFTATDYIEQFADYRNCRAGYTKMISEMSDFPDVSALQENRDFSTLEVTRDGIVFPLIGDYNRINSINVNVTDVQYSLSLILIKKEVPENAE